MLPHLEHSEQEAIGDSADPAVAIDRPESESSWGELQDATNGEEQSPVDNGNVNGNEEQKGDAERTVAEGDNGQDVTDYPEAYDSAAVGGQEGGAAGVGAGFADVARQDAQEQRLLEDEGSTDQQHVGGDVVMVSPLGHGPSQDGDGEDRQEVEGQAFALELGGSASGGTADTVGVRRPNLGALMTMLVVSLRMQRLVHWVVRKRCLDGLSEENLIDLLSALEVMPFSPLPPFPPSPPASLSSCYPSY